MVLGNQEFTPFIKEYSVMICCDDDEEEEILNYAVIIGAIFMVEGYFKVLSTKYFWNAVGMNLLAVEQYHNL